MAAITVKRASQTTQQSATSPSYADIPGVSIASSEFVAGDRYLILATAQVAGGNGHARSVRLVHGSTAFAESEQIDSGPDGLYHVYQFMTVWTAVASEGLSMQFSVNSGGQTVYADQCELIAIKLDDDLVENTDWYYNERTTDDVLSTTPTDGASITFTPGVSGNWLVLTYAQIQSTVNTISCLSQLNRSGEASSSTPEARVEFSPSAGASNVGFLLSRVFALTAASNTFKEVSYVTTGTSHTRLHSSVFALRLGAFDQSISAYTEADQNLTSTDFETTIQSVNITPNITGDFIVGAYWGYDGGNIGRSGEFRLQAEGSDIPATQTSDVYQFRLKDATDERPLTLITSANLASGASRSITLDASSSGTPTTAQHASLWAFSTELASGEEQLPPTITPDTADDSLFTTSTPTLLFTGTDPNTVAEDLRYQIQITDNPDGFTGGVVVTQSITTGSGTVIHPNPMATLTWEGNYQVDDRPGMSFLGNGGILDSIDFDFGPHETFPENTDGSYLIHVYLASGYSVDPVPAAWQASTAYDVGDIVRPTSMANDDLHFVYRCTVAGTSDNTEPSWPGNGVAWKTVADGTTVADGSVTWEALAGMHPINPADPVDTPTPLWVAISDIYPYNPGGADGGFKQIDFSGANRIRLEKDTWYIAILDWRPNNATNTNALAVRSVSITDATSPGNVYIDASLSNNNGPRIIDDLKHRIRESYVLLDKVSGTDTGFVNQDDGGDTDPFTDGDQIGFTVQAGDALSDGVYYWRVRVSDPAGSNTWSDWSTTRTFTVDAVDEDSGVLFKSIGTISIDADGTLSIDGTTDETIANFTLDADGEVNITGSTNETIGSITLESDADVEISGSLFESIGDFTIDGDSELVVDGSLSESIGDIGLEFSGQLSIEGSTTESIGTITIESDADLYISGQLSESIGDITVSSEGTSAGGATLEQTIGQIVLDADATLELDASLNESIGDITLESDADLFIFGAVSEAIGNITLDSSAGNVNTGTLQSFIGDITIDLESELEIAAILSTSIGAIQASVIAQLDITATVTNTIQPIQLESDAGLSIDGELESSIGQISVSFAGTSETERTGQLNKTLQAIVLSSAGISAFTRRGTVMGAKARSTITSTKSTGTI